MKKIFINGMMCQHCAKTVTKVLNGLGGSDVEVNLAENYAVANIEADDAEIKSAIESKDFKVVDIVRV